MLSSSSSPRLGRVRVAPGAESTPLAWQPHGSRRLQALGRDVHDRADARVLPPLRGSPGQLRDRADLRAPRGLFTRDSVQALRELDARSTGDGDERRRARMLLDFAVEGYVGEATKAVEEELARTEAALTIEVGDERLGFREAPVAQANEADAGRRAEIERALLAATDEQLGRHHRELIERQHACAVELGWASYVDMCEHCKGIDLRALSEQTAAFAQRQRVELSAGARAGAAPDARDRHGRAAPRRPAPLLPGRRAGPPLPGREVDRELRRDDARPRDRRSATGRRDVRHRVPSEQVAAGVLRAGARARRGVSGRGSGRRPGRLRTLFHEGGHTEHTANVDPGLPFEFRCLGDNSISETYAFLLQHLVEDPEWLSRRLGVDDAADLVAHARAQRLVYLRRYAGKLAYELELHGGGGAGAADTGPTGWPSGTRSCSAARSQSSGRPRPTSPTSIQGSTAPATCGRGRSRPTCARTCASGSGRRGSSRARPETCCAGCGATASASTPRSCSGS